MSAAGRLSQRPSEAPPTLPVREALRHRMKMVINQLEVILQELKAVASELKEVVKQIDKLTCDFDFELEPDDWTIATTSSTSSSDTARNHEQCGALSDCGRLGFLTPDILSDSWEFCSFLELSPETAKVDPGGDGKELPPTATEPDYRLMNGGLVPNGPDSSSEETIGGGPCPKTLARSSGTRERVRFSDKVLYHALCCDDDDDDDDDEEGAQSNSGVTTSIGLTPTPTPTNTTITAANPTITAANPTITAANATITAANAGEGRDRAGKDGANTPTPAPNPRHHCHPPAGTATAGKTPDRRKVMRNNSTQTVSHKSTQTLLTYASSTTQPSSKKEDIK